MENNEVESTEVESTEEKPTGGTQATTGGDFQAQAARLLKLKIDGVEEDLPEDEVIKYAQIGKKANKTIQEAASEKKRIMRLYEMAKQNPMAVLKEFNPDFDEDNYISAKLEKQMERNMKSREEQERDDALEELRKYQDREKQSAKEKEDAEFDKLVTDSKSRLDVEIADALKSISMKPSKATVKRLASYMLMARNEGLNLTAKDLAAVVKQDMVSEYMEQLELSDDDTFASLIGEKNLTRSQKIALAKMKKNPGQTQAKPQGVKQEEAPKKIYGFEAFLRENLRN